MDRSEPAIFDGHNDVLLKLFEAGGRKAVAGFATGCSGHVDLPRARRGGFGGGFFAIYVPSPEEDGDGFENMSKAGYDIALPDAMKAEEALPVVIEQMAILLEMQAQGLLRICTGTEEIRACLENGQMAAVMHLEGADAIDPDLHLLDVMHAAGLRSLGPVWSRPTIFAHGVPFRFPASPDTGPGLTQEGRNLVRRCNDLGIMVDLSHMNEAGFWDVAAISTAPLVATHSNAHALCRHARNLTDRQLAAIGESGGVAGLNFAAAFLRADGRMVPEVGLEVVLAHLDHMMAIAGEDAVALGSDFDGATVPAEIGDVAGLGKLRAAMRAHGYGEELIEKLCYRNWLRVLSVTWGEEAGRQARNEEKTVQQRREE